MNLRQGELRLFPAAIVQTKSQNSMTLSTQTSSCTRTANLHRQTPVSTFAQGNTKLMAFVIQVGRIEVALDSKLPVPTNGTVIPILSSEPHFSETRIWYIRAMVRKLVWNHRSPQGICRASVRSSGISPICTCAACYSLGILRQGKK